MRIKGLSLLIIIIATLVVSVPLALAGDSARVIFAADLHYLDPGLLDEGSGLIKALAEGDGKLTIYIDEIVDAFIAQVIEEKPDALVLGGDIAFNGEKISHEALAGKLSAVERAGIPVLVAPGNHDVNRPTAYRYAAGATYHTPNVTPEEFRDIYFPLGANDAVSFDGASLSYASYISDGVMFLMIDSCRYAPGDVQDSGYIRPETLAWMEDVLGEAREKGVTVISVSHHNLIEHSAMFTAGYTLINYPRPMSLLEEYGVRLHLSGHMHIQHVGRAHDGRGIYDAASSALAVYPFQYAAIDIDDSGDITYTTRRTDVSAWAKASGLTDPNLLDFDAFSLAYTRACTAAHTARRLAGYPGLTDDERAAMGDFAETLHVEYFAGMPYSVTDEDAAYMLWRERCADLFFTEYLSSMFAQPTVRLPLVIR